MTDEAKHSLRPLKPGWLKDFSPDPGRIYHGDTELGATEDEAMRARERARQERELRKSK